MSVQIKLGENVPLELLLFDGDDTKYPLAYLIDETHTAIPGSPFALTNIGLGRYVNDSYILPLNSTNYRLLATYIIYEDAGHTIEDMVYERAEDIFDVADSQTVVVNQLANYVNRMSTSFDTLSSQQGITVWAEKNGMYAPGTNCSISVYNDLATVIWSASSPTPMADGVFKFVNAFAPLADGSYYVEITITVDGQPRTNKQPFVAVG